MNLEELSMLLASERDQDKLQGQGSLFYDRAAQYIQQLEKARTEAVSYKEADMISDEIKNARMLIEGIFERRLSKLIYAALNTSSGIKINVEGLSEKEKTLYETLVNALETGRNEILVPILEVSGRANQGKNLLGGTTTKEQPIENSLSNNSDLKEEVMMVKVLKDIPRFVGVDGRHYQLSEEDVVVLPKANALVLCNKNVAIPLQNQEG
jgi:DNA replication factor GINS